MLIGLGESYPEKLGKYVNFEATRSWVRFLCKRMKFPRRAAATTRLVITRTLWNEIKFQFLNEISQKVLLNRILDELIINADQAPPKFVATDNITIAGKGQKHISKRSIIFTVCELLYGKTLRSK